MPLSDVGNCFESRDKPARLVPQTVRYRNKVSAIEQ